MTAPIDKKSWLTQRLKYILLINLIIGVLFFGLGSYIYFNLRQRDEVQGFKYMETLSENYAIRTKAILDEAVIAVRNLALIMSNYESIPRDARRRAYMDLTKRILLENERWIAIWVQWEPNLLDGLDQRYANSVEAGAGTETGAFAPYWTRGPKGVILEPSYNFHYEQDYYTKPRDLGHEWITEPYYDEPQGVRTLMVSATAPIYDSRGVFHGVVGVDYSLSLLALDLGLLKLYRSGFGRLISSEGILAYHPNPTRLGQKAPEWEGEEAEQIRKALQSGETFTKLSYSVALNEVTIKSFVPFKVGQTNSTWMYGAVVPQDEFFEESRNFLEFFVLTFIFVLIPLILLTSLVVGRIFKPIIQLRASMKEFASGNADLRTRLDARGRHEIAQLATFFNTFVENLGQIVLQTRAQMENLEQVSHRLQTNMDTIGNQVDRVLENLRGMKATAGNQASNIMEVSSTVEEITGNLKSLNQQVERQNQALASAASAVEEMVANIQNITRNVDISMKSFTRLKNVSDQGYEKLEEVNEVIRNISLQSEGLQEANSIINNIASQTNLLAMNAAIEAAHAGEAGKGFAVVADEIRKLAEESAGRSHEITQLLKTLHALSDQAVNSSTEAGAAFEAIRQSVDEVTNRQLEIRAAVEQQSMGNRQVLEGVQQLKQIAAEVEMGSREMAMGSQNILKLVMNVVESSRNITKSIQDIESATDEIESSTQGTIDLSRVNRKAAEQLGFILKSFRI